MHLKRLLVLVLFVSPLVASAEPAPWYWWVSKLDSARVCWQTSPGSGWYRAGGPYKNSRCRNDQVR
ncbi:MAG: hypothetical protein CVU16_10620 [Betaproteobacteria bacterium HGW-Betaproteobacteria-10]|nr:MAG: hypothetical protein CVU16_10620 [Betaproteobacteria bacterium HGW-Betaproteobacteria-10]